jgi:hypothetical protein
MWIKIVLSILGITSLLFAGLLYWIHKAFSRFPPMLTANKERVDWIRKNCNEDTRSGGSGVRRL